MPGKRAELHCRVEGWCFEEFVVLQKLVMESSVIEGEQSCIVGGN